MPLKPSGKGFHCMILGCWILTSVIGLSCLAPRLAGMETPRPEGPATSTPALPGLQETIGQMDREILECSDLVLPMHDHYLDPKAIRLSNMQDLSEDDQAWYARKGLSIFIALEKFNAKLASMESRLNALSVESESEKSYRNTSLTQIAKYKERSRYYMAWLGYGTWNLSHLRTRVGAIIPIICPELLPSSFEKTKGYNIAPVWTERTTDNLENIEYCKESSSLLGTIEQERAAHHPHFDIHQGKVSPILADLPSILHSFNEFDSIDESRESLTTRLQRYLRDLDEAQFAIAHLADGFYKNLPESCAYYYAANLYELDFAAQLLVDISRCNYYLSSTKLASTLVEQSGRVREGTASPLAISGPTDAATEESKAPATPGAVSHLEDRIQNAIMEQKAQLLAIDKHVLPLFKRMETARSSNGPQEGLLASITAAIEMVDAFQEGNAKVIQRIKAAQGIMTGRAGNGGSGFASELDAMTLLMGDAALLKKLLLSNKVSAQELTAAMERTLQALAGEAQNRLAEAQRAESARSQADESRIQEVEAFERARLKRVATRQEQKVEAQLQREPFLRSQRELEGKVLEPTLEDLRLAQEQQRLFAEEQKEARRLRQALAEASRNTSSSSSSSSSTPPPPTRGRKAWPVEWLPEAIAEFSKNVERLHRPAIHASVDKLSEDGRLKGTKPLIMAHGIYEMRPGGGTVLWRPLYAFHKDKFIILALAPEAMEDEKGFTSSVERAMARLKALREKTK
jgi:hypothetical protein